MSTESGLVRRIVKAVKWDYPRSWAFKTVGNPYQMAGVPDLILCVEGHFIGLEVKHQKSGESIAHARGRATRVQLAQIRAINTAGGAAAVVVSEEEALELIRYALNRKDAD